MSVSHTTGDVQTARHRDEGSKPYKELAWNSGLQEMYEISSLCH